MVLDNERMQRLREIADGDRPACLITIQLYDENDQPGSPRIIGWCERENLARAMCAIADHYLSMNIDVLVGSVDAQEASDDDWCELMDYLAKQNEGDDLEAVCVVRGMMDGNEVAHQSVRGQQPEWLPEEWEEITLDPEVLAYHGGPQPTGAGVDVCETCGGTGTVKHPTIPGYYGDCPDCGNNDTVM
jgi:hypothetical protein